MGFTIGGMREIRELRPALRRRGRSPESIAVAEYTGLWGWEVVPGTRAARSGARVECSCRVPGCPAPGAHPLDGAAEIPGGTGLGEATELWSRFPGAALLLPVGRGFDVLEVAEAAGRRALVRLERMGLPLGPVAVAPHGRVWFLVAPGAAADLPRLLYRMGWDDTDLDLRGRGPGEYITAPPSDLSGLGPVRWLRPPAPGMSRQPPRAQLLLGTLAYVCHRCTS